MKPEEAPCSILRRIDVSSSRCLRDEGTPHTETYSLQGGVFSDTKLAWLSRGPVLEVINTIDGSVVARWTFGSVIKDLSTKVTCVEEFKQPALNRMPQPLVQALVGVECELTGGMVCVFNFTGPRVLRAINIPSKVTSLALVSPGMEVNALNSSLEIMDGIVGVGTKDGHIFLLDLRRTDCQNDLMTGSASHWENLHDELRPCQLIPLRGGGAEQRMKEFPNDHLCLHLNHSAFSHFKRFVVQFPRGDYKQFLPENSSVTSMLYIPALSSLIVGFAFGSFQIWSLKTLTLLYTCPTGGGPVERILFQEPCDDPNAFCYLWIVRGSTGDASDPDSVNIPTVVMYTLCYDEKLWVHECGNVFNNFLSCNIAFKFEFDQDEEIAGGRVIGMRVIDQPLRTPPSSSPDDNTLGSSTSSLSLCLLVWETWGTSGPQDGLDPGNTHMAVFDLNQWYVDHMPSRLSARGGVSRNKTIAGYVAKYRLGETLCGDNVDGSTVGMLLDVNIDPRSLLPFTTVQNVEEHSRPSALQFRSVAFLEKQLVHVNHPGIQRALLATLSSTGPSLLLTPTYVFHQCLALGLRPLQYDMPDSVNLELVEQRCYVILVALEHRLTRWLSSCARECSDGRMDAAGCTLNWFLNVLWSRLADLKRIAVELCVELFDLSGESLDANASRQLRHIVAVLRVLKSLFDNVTKEGWHRRLMDSHHVELQKQALHLEVQYYEVLQWFIGAGLLPELPENSSVPDNGHVPYPAKKLVAVYSARRTELQELYKGYEEEDKAVDRKDDGVQAPPQDLLMIDGLISHEPGGKRLQSEWERDAGRAGGRFANMYPPSSIQGLLRTYLVRDISYDIKTRIVTYVFMDLAATLDSDKCASNLHRFMQFPSAFNMSPGSIKLTQAFWHLDHRSFEVALEMLLDPLVSRLDVELWQHRSVVRALMLQGQHKLALRYLSAREPPLNSDHDIRLRLNLLLSNDLVHEAFMFQRDYRSYENSQSLLEYFFRGCEKRQLLPAVLQLTLSEEEEKAFILFLAANKNILSEDLHVMYLLKRFRYVEAFDVNQRLRKTALESGRAGVGSFDDEHSSTRDIVVNALYKTLPNVTRSLAAHCAQERSKVGSWKQVKRPLPLSVDVRQCNPEMKYKSPFIETALAKTREAWAKFLPQTPPSTDTKSFVERTPFLCTPRAKLFTFTKSAEKPRSFRMDDMWSRKRLREDDSDLSSLPASKLSRSADRPSISHQNIDAAVNSSAGVLTPIVKRQSPNSRLKSRLSKSGDFGKSSVTPHSIIKSRDSFGLLKSPFRTSSESPISSRTSSNRSQYVSMAKSILAVPDKPEQSKPCLARNAAPAKLDFELSDDEDEVNVSSKDDPSKSVMSDRSVGDSVISNDLESDDEANSRLVAMESFVLPSTTPSPARTPAQKRISLSSMVVLSEARKANFLASPSRWSSQANRSSVTFGDNSVCVYDKDEPASTATSSSELPRESDEDSREKDFDEDSREKDFDEDSRERMFDEDSREKDLNEDSREKDLNEDSRERDLNEDSREREFNEDSREQDFENRSSDDIRGDSSRDGEDDLGISLAALRRRCHQTVQPRPSVADILNKSFEERQSSPLKKSDWEESAPKDSSDRHEGSEAVDVENDFESSPLVGISALHTKPNVTSRMDQEEMESAEKDEQNEIVEVTDDDDSRDKEERSDQQEDSSPVKVREEKIEEEVKKVETGKQESSLLFSMRCALLSPGFRNRLVRKSFREPTKESPVEENVVEEEPVQNAPGEDVVDVADAEKQSPESDSEDLGEVSGDVAAESLISNDLNSEEEEEEEVQEQSRPSSKFWSFLLPSRTPSPVRTPEKRPSLTNVVLLSEARKRCHARVKPRPTLHPEVLGKIYADDDVRAEDSDDGPSTSTPKKSRESEETVEEVVSTHRSLRTARYNNDFESEEVISVRTTTTTNFASCESSESDLPKSSDVEAVEVSDDDSNNIVPEVMEAITAEAVSSEKDSEQQADAMLPDALKPDTVDEAKQDVQDKDVVMLRDSEEEMEELRVEDSEGEDSDKVQESGEPMVKETEPSTPPNVASLITESTAQRTPRANKLVVNRESETPRSAHRSLRRSRLTDSPIFSGVRTRRGAAQVSGSTSTREGSPDLAESSKSSPVREVIEQEGQSSPHRMRSSGPVEEVEEVKSAHKAKGATVVKEAGAQESTPRRKRGASVSKEIGAQEGTPRRTRRGSVSTDAEVKEVPSRRTRGASVALEEVQEGTARRTRGGSVAKDTEVKEDSSRRTRGASVAKEEVQEGTPRRTRGGSVAKDSEVREGSRTRGTSVAKEEAQETTPRRKRGGSVAKDSEVLEGTLRRTRGSSVAKDGEVPENSRRTRGSSVDLQEETPRRTRASSVLEEVREEEEAPVSAPPGSSVMEEEKSSSAPSRPTRSSTVSKEVQEEVVTPRVTRSSSSVTEEDKTSTPRRTRSSSVAQESEPIPKLETPKPVVEPHPETHSAGSSKDGEEPKTRRQGRVPSVAKEVESTSGRETRSSVHETTRRTRRSSELKEESPLETSSSIVASRRTRSSSTISEKEDASTPRQTRSSEKSPRKKKADEMSETSSVSGKRGRRSKRSKTTELESSFESKDGDTESNYSRRSNASPANSPDSKASRVRSRVASVSSVESGRKPASKRKSGRRSAEPTNDSSLILQEKLAQISESEESVEGAPSKKARSETSQPPRREGSVAKSIHSEVTERVSSESGSEFADPSSVMKAVKQEVDLSSRDRIEAAIQEYSSTRRLTRKQQELLSRSLEICAQPERFRKASLAAISDVEEDGEDHDDTQSQSSVRSSVRLRKKRETERRASPSSTATTEILSDVEQPDTPTRRATRRISASQNLSPSSVTSGASEVSATRRRGRPTAAQRKALLKEIEEEVTVAGTTSTEIETSSQASSRKNTRSLRNRSVTPDVETHFFSEPQSPDSDVGSLSNVSVYRESFQFSQPQNVDVQEDVEATALARRTRQSKLTPQPLLGPIREESQSSTDNDDDSNTKSSGNEKRRSWHLFTPLKDTELAAARKQKKKKLKQQKPTVPSAFPRRSQSAVFELLFKDEEDSND